MDEIPHTIDAIRVSQHLANAFVDTARRSSHAPRSHEEDLELQIYDTCPIFGENSREKREREAAAQV
jgi:gamma-glutamyl hydrolase